MRYDAQIYGRQSPTCLTKKEAVGFAETLTLIYEIICTINLSML
jgi:hypothetical protein